MVFNPNSATRWVLAAEFAAIASFTLRWICDQTLCIQLEDINSLTRRSSQGLYSRGSVQGELEFGFRLKEFQISSAIAGKKLLKVRLARDAIK